MCTQLKWMVVITYTQDKEQRKYIFLRLLYFTRGKTKSPGGKNRQT